MIGTGDWSRAWTYATAASVALHATAVGALVWQPDFSAMLPDVPPISMRLEITSVAPSTAIAPAQTLTPVTTPELPDTTENTVETGGMEQTPDDVLSPVDSAEPLVISGNMPVESLPVVSGTGATPRNDPTVPEDTPSNAPPADPRIVELFDLIRDRLAEPCLLALPALLGEDQIQLGVLAAEDRQISALMRDVTAQVETPVEEHAVLLDNRQCPALAFARRDPGYPVPGLSVQIDAQDIASGSNLQGRVSGGAGLYTTLLLIDDNGVVHDLRRFLVGSAAGSRFSIPMARTGQARDTHQLILAIASPDRPDAVSRHAGELAKDFFDALGREAGPRPRIGVASVYVR